MKEPYDEIERLAYDIYEKSGRIDGKDMDNWLEAERIVASGRLQKKAPKSRGKRASSAAAEQGSGA